MDASPGFRSVFVYGMKRSLAAFIAMICRDQRETGAGFAGDLLVDSLQRFIQAADVLGIAVVLLDVLDCGDPKRTARRQALCRSYGC